MIGGAQSSVDVVDVSAAAPARCARMGCSRRSRLRSLARPRPARPPSSTYYSGGLSSCGVGSIAWAMALVFDRQAFPKGRPRRSRICSTSRVSRQARAAERAALHARARAARRRRRAGRGLCRAGDAGRRRPRFRRARQDQAGDLLVGQGARTDHLLLGRRSAIAAGYSGRIFRAASAIAQRIDVIWDGQIYDLDIWAVPKSAPTKTRPSASSPLPQTRRGSRRRPA